MREWVETVLNFVTELAEVLVWPVVAACVALMFSDELRGLLQRIGTLKFGDAALEFQPAVIGVTRAASARHPNRFLTLDEINEVATRYIDAKAKPDPAMEALLVFETLRQHTWLVVTLNHIVCVLDDEEGRRAGQLCRWKLGPTERRDVSVQPHVREFTVGLHTKWLYSPARFSSGELLKVRIEELMGRMKVPSPADTRGKSG